jgi:hypothetical protein
MQRGKTMQDKRASPRHKVSFTGKLLSADLSLCVNCVVEDLSVGGAQVRVPVRETVPDRIYLWQSKTGGFFECDVRWRKPGLMGLHFIDIASRQKSRALIERCGFGVGPGSFSMPPAVRVAA